MTAAKKKPIEAPQEAAQAPAPAKATKAPPKQAVARVASQKPPSQAVALATSYSPPELLNAAILQKADITVIERLAALAERWQTVQMEREQRIAFSNAIADAKAEMPTVIKNRRVHFKSNKPGATDTDYMHEDLAGVAETIGPTLHKFGLSFRFRTVQPEPGQLTVFCVLSHRSGHFEENSLTCAVDTSGNKNHLQAIASAQTYLERYTLKAAVGIAAKVDDDGRLGGDLGPKPDVISAEQAKQIKDLLKQKGRPEDKFLTWCDVDAIENLPIALLDDVLATLNKIPDAPT